MKFRDGTQKHPIETKASAIELNFKLGMWLTAENLTVAYAEEIHTCTRTSPERLSLLCPTRKVRSRGDTLNLSTLNTV